METQDTAPQLPPAELDSGTIIRDALVLQGKLVIDGIRDALLIPVSLVAAIISIFQSGNDKGRLFYDVVQLGRRSERWIDLFAAADRVHAPAPPPEGASLDEYLAQVESRIVQDYRGRELTRSAREALDGLVERIKAARRRTGEPGDQEI